MNLPASSIQSTPAPHIARHALLLINDASGGENPSDLVERITKAFAEEGWQTTVIPLKAQNDIAAQCDAVAAQAAEQGLLAVVAGGDGTVNAMAAACHQHAAVMAVIPLGTFNYFAREHGVPTVPEEAVKIAATGRVKTVGIGMVNQQIFLNNASLGLYTRIIRQREEASSRFGRMRMIAALSAMRSLFTRHPLFDITLTINGKSERHKTSLVFVGNNALQLENLGLAVAECPQQGKLGLVVMKKTRWTQTLRFLWRSLVRNLRDESRLEECCVTELTIASARASIDLVLDGEIIPTATPLHFRAVPQALSLIIPHEEDENI